MRLLILISIVLLSTSCLKKIDATEELNTNIFDKDYAGTIWFRIDEMYSYINTDGQTKIHLIVLVPRSYLPNLKPSYLPVDCSVNDQEFGVINAPLNYNGDYEFEFDADPDGSTTYCLTMGIYNEDDNEVINTFTDCENL